MGHFLRNSTARLMPCGLQFSGDYATNTYFSSLFTLLKASTFSVVIFLDLFLTVVVRGSVVQVLPRTWFIELARLFSTNPFSHSAHLNAKDLVRICRYFHRHYVHSVCHLFILPVICLFSFHAVCYRRRQASLYTNCTQLRKVFFICALTSCAVPIQI